MTANKISQTEQSVRTTQPGQANSPRRILVVEDDREQRQTNAMVLAFTGYTVEVAEDGAAAWEALQASRYDLLITDNHMPRLTGLELLKEMRSAGMKLPVIMATGKLPTEELSQNPWLEPVALLAKPYVAEQLLETVKTVLQKIAPNIIAHPNALIEEGVSIGRGTRVWAFAHVVTGAVLGEDCNICDHTFIEGGVRIGNRATIKCGVFLWDGMILEDDVFIGPGAVFTNDTRPRSKKYLAQPLPTMLKEGCSLGAGSITLPNLTIGRWAMVGAGAVVTHSVPDFALVIGNPARFHAWVCRCGEKLIPAGGRLLDCKCGLRYERIAENEVKELVANGSHPHLPENCIEPAIKGNGHETNNW